MEKKDVQTIMKRIQNNYNEFVVDDYAVSEWLKELKDYDFDDVMNKVEEHFRSEKFGNRPPKVYLLTKYLVKTKDKTKKHGIKITCHLCHKKILLNNFSNHFNRCSSVDYLNRKNIEYFNKPINKDKYMNMDRIEFEKVYDKFCEYILKHSNDPKEINYLEHYFIGRGY